MSTHRPKHAPRVPFALLATGLVVGGLCLLLALNTASAANELDRHELASKDAAISARLEQLRNEVAASAAPEALAQAAARLGMVPAGNPAFLVIGRDGAVRVLGNAKSATPRAQPRTHTDRHSSHPNSRTSGTATTPANTTSSAEPSRTAEPSKTAEPTTSTDSGSSRAATTSAGTHASGTRSSSASTPSAPSTASATRSPTPAHTGGGAR